MHELPNGGGKGPGVAPATDHDRAAAAQIALLNEIVSGVAHDMGTPLNVISGYAESMLMSLPVDSPARRQTGAIVEQTRRVAGLIRQMLDVVGVQPSSTPGEVLVASPGLLLLLDTGTGDVIRRTFADADAGSFISLGARSIPTYAGAQCAC